VTFPRDEYAKLIVSICDPGATIYWKGSPEPFYTPRGVETPVVIRLDVGTAYGYGTSEVREEWIPSAQNGEGAWQRTVLQRMTWPFTIEAETFDASSPGEDFIMAIRARLRWPTNIARIQALGLSTIRVGHVMSVIRTGDEGTSFAAILEITHGQVLATVDRNDTGGWIGTVQSLPGTITGGTPVDPIADDLGPLVIST